LTAAFNNAWPALHHANKLDSAAHSEWFRKRLADYILACASSGEFDANKLAEQVVRALSRSRALMGFTRWPLVQAIKVMPLTEHKRFDFESKFIS
jgi:hypothetical protein